jgi:hypothetical protein
MQRPKRFCDHYTHMTRSDLLALARWDRRENDARIYRPWKPLEHPQLGQVEVGGFDPRFGIWNPPFSEIAAVCSAQSAAFLRVAALAPRVELSTAEPRSLGDGSWLLEVSVDNLGYLPTYVLSSAKHLPHSEELWIDVATTDSLRVEGPARVRLGHLEGWGRGIRGAGSGMHVPRSRGSSSSARASFVLRGRGTAALSVRSSRIGVVQKQVELG